MRVLKIVKSRVSGPAFSPFSAPRRATIPEMGERISVSSSYPLQLRGGGFPVRFGDVPFRPEHPRIDADQNPAALIPVPGDGQARIQDIPIPEPDLPDREFPLRLFQVYLAV